MMAATSNWPLQYVMTSDGVFFFFLSTLCSRPLGLIDSDQLLLHLPGRVDQFMESSECNRLFLFIV